MVLGVLGFFFFHPRTGLVREAAAGDFSFSQGSSEHSASPGGASASASQPPAMRLRSAPSQDEETLQQHRPVSLQAWVTISKERCKRIQKEL